MEAEGLTSLLPLSEISVMGILPVLERLPRFIAAMSKIAEAAIAASTRRARHHRQSGFHAPGRAPRAPRRPDLPIVNYVSPSVWAWRPGRARRMRGYIDHVLALLPFEPAAYRRLGGPPCTYVGHPLVEQIGG